MGKTIAGFREIAHTADWQLEVWAPDLVSLLEQAARGMYALSGAKLKAGSRQPRRLVLRASDPEGLLVSFLSELLYLGEHEGLGSDGYQLDIHQEAGEWMLRAVLDSARILALDKEIKAVTYHNLTICRTEEGYQVNVVFDV
jgi:SHS2 domain-containing protein